MRTRRAFLAAAAAAVVAGGGGIVAERGAVRRWFAELTDPEPAAPPPTRSPGQLRSGVFASRACGRQVGWQLSYPPGSPPGESLPVALVLHGRGGSETSAFGELQLDGYLADVVAGGSPPFALAAVDGGDHAYWHGRRSGEDPQAMLLQEFIPLLARMGLRTSKVGVFGWSMGGYGGLLLAETVGAARIAAVAADSPALWQQASETASGAFDGPADFAAHDVFANRERLAGVRSESRAAPRTRSTRRCALSSRACPTWRGRTSPTADTPTASGGAARPLNSHFWATRSRGNGSRGNGQSGSWP